MFERCNQNLHRDGSSFKWHQPCNKQPESAVTNSVDIQNALCKASLGSVHTPSIAFRHLPPRKDVVNQCLEFGLSSHSSDLIDGDRLYSAILRSLEQTHCARMWFHMSDWLFITRFCFCFLTSTEVVYLQRWHGWCHMKLQPSRLRFCVHHTNMLQVTSCKATYVRCMRV